MTSLTASLRSSVGKKYLMALTGLIWVGFAIGHLIGNYLLFAGRQAFNSYAFFLEELGHGMLIYVAEAGLVLALVVHVVNGVGIVLHKQTARPTDYQRKGNAGGRSRKSIFSLYMILSGLFLLGFLVFHVTTFKFGQGEMTTVAGQPYRDLYGIVVDWFAYPQWVALYAGLMLMLMAHLKHGVWSAFQSLGLINHRVYPVLVTASVVFAVLLALGFIGLPITVYTFHDQFARPQGGLF